MQNFGVKESTPLRIPRWRREDDNEMGLRGYDGVVRTGLIWLRTGTSGGSCEHGSEPSSSIEFWEILEN
jgi:hypothetical protein